MANKIYQHDETAITWLASGGSAVLTLTSLAATAGRNGALYDFGTAARAFLFAWRFWMKFADTPVVNEVIRLYWRSSDGTNPDNDDGGDVALSSTDKLLNLHPLGVMRVDEASTTPVYVKSGVVYLPWRYGGPVVYNATADAFSSTAGDHGFKLTPVPPEAQ